jgi:phosphopantothenoylcysteine decarboxylase/phosphopantothenate--cysteine ligase
MAGHSKRVLLIVGGGVAAYKTLELVRLLRKADVLVRPILTSAGARFVTPLTLGALAEDKVHQDLFALTEEAEMGHIELSRSADLIVVAPATADLMAKAALGLADDLASTVLLATNTGVLMAPAMNVRMWEHPATQGHVATLMSRGVGFVGPGEGPMACGEYGLGRLAEPAEILEAIRVVLDYGQQEDPAETLRLDVPGPPPPVWTPERAAPPRAPDPPPAAAPLPIRTLNLRAASEPPRPPAPIAPPLVAPPPPAPAGLMAGKRALVTAGPTLEPIDPVRVLTNRSSGKQGYAIAEALQRLGAEVTLVSGPTALETPPGVRRVVVETAEQMMAACQNALPVRVAVLVAAVADWRPADADRHKIRKGAMEPVLSLTENPDILALLSRPGPRRPSLVVGFAAETQDLEVNARAKRLRKGCDWIVANDVSQEGVMGGDNNAAVLITPDGAEVWPLASKAEIADKLAHRIAEALA